MLGKAEHATVRRRLRVEGALLGRYRFLMVVVACTAGLDQGTKVWAKEHLRDLDALSVLGDFIQLHIVHNMGTAWGLGADMSLVIRRVVFPAVGLAFSVVLCSLYAKWQSQGSMVRLGLALMLGGGVGNLIDRCRLGYVVDFISFQFIDDHLRMEGTINLADAAMLVGVSLLGFYILKSGKIDKNRTYGGAH